MIYWIFRVWKLNVKRREIEDINLSEIVEQAIDLQELEIKKKNLNIDINIEENLPLLKLDKTEVTKIINNLISNAVKYNRLEW